MLAFISSLFGAVGRVRAGLYRAGLLRRHRLGAPVISVGNLAVGGTGKTPLVALVAQTLQQAGFEPAVLSRGYKGDAEQTGLLVSDGQRILSQVRQCGDEPFLLARLLPGVPLAVGKDRRRSAGLVPPAQQLGKRIFILDDAYQHLRVHRDLDLLVLDATDPFAGERPMPAGRLREPLSGIRRADWIILTRSHLATGLEETKAEVGRRHPSARLFTVHHAPAALIDVRSGLRPLEELSGAPVIALAGIGKPQLFSEDIRRMGIEVTEEAFFADHHWFTQKELDHILARLSTGPARAVLTTEKDSVRLESLRFGQGQVFALRIQARADADEDFRRALVDWAEGISRQDAKTQ